MAGIANYGELKTQVASWVHRTDLTSQMPVFLGIAEAQIRRDVKTRWQELVATGALTGETLAHPSRYLAARRFAVNGHKLRFRTPEQYYDLSDREVTGSYFTSIGTNLYVLGGTSGDTYELVYLESFTDLSADADTNSLLTNAPDVVLWAMCRAAALYIMDDGMVSKFDGLYGAAVTLLNNKEKEMQFSGGPLNVRPDTVES